MKLDVQTVEILLDKKWSISTAESCSGGLLANTITNASGSSNYFSKGFITYSDEAKIQELNIPKDTINKYSSYSGKVAELMAESARKKSEATFGLSTTGIAPPGDPSTSLPTGKVFIGLSTPENSMHFEFEIKSKSRRNFKKKVVEITLKLLDDMIIVYSQTQI